MFVPPVSREEAGEEVWRVSEIRERGRERRKHQETSEQRTWQDTSLKWKAWKLLTASSWEESCSQMRSPEESGHNESILKGEMVILGIAQAKGSARHPGRPGRGHHRGRKKWRHRCEGPFWQKAANNCPKGPAQPSLRRSLPAPRTRSWFSTIRSDSKQEHHKQETERCPSK